jgi:hypothetical protein
MGHITYEEHFLVDNAPTFCKVCRSKMYQVEVGGGDLELKTDLINYDTQQPFYEPDGYGGCNTVAVRPHIVQGTACGYGKAGTTIGADLWHGVVGGSPFPICQTKIADEDYPAVLKMMDVIKPQNDLMPTIDESMPED